MSRPSFRITRRRVIAFFAALGLLAGLAAAAFTSASASASAKSVRTSVTPATKCTKPSGGILSPTHGQSVDGKSVKITAKFGCLPSGWSATIVDVTDQVYMTTRFVGPKSLSNGKFVFTDQNLGAENTTTTVTLVLIVADTTGRATLTKDWTHRFLPLGGGHVRVLDSTVVNATRRNS